MLTLPLSIPAVAEPAQRCERAKEEWRQRLSEEREVNGALALSLLIDLQEPCGYQVEHAPTEKQSVLSTSVLANKCGFQGLADIKLTLLGVPYNTLGTGKFAKNGMEEVVDARNPAVGVTSVEGAVTASSVVYLAGVPLPALGGPTVLCGEIVTTTCVTVWWVERCAESRTEVACTGQAYGDVLGLGIIVVSATITAVPNPCGHTYNFYLEPIQQSCVDVPQTPERICVV